MNRALAWGYVFLPLAVLLWSGNTVVSKAALSADVPPIALAFWRWIVAIAILAPFAAGSAWRLRRTVLAHWRFFTVFGVVSVGSFNTFFYLGLERTSAVQGTLILAVLPALVVLSAWLFQGAPITRRQGAGVVVSIAGAALIVVRGDVQVLLSLTPNAGDLWCLAAVAAWTVQIVTTARIPKEVDIWSFTATKRRQREAPADRQGSATPAGLLLVSVPGPHHRRRLAEDRLRRIRPRDTRTHRWRAGAFHDTGY